MENEHILYQDLENDDIRWKPMIFKDPFSLHEKDRQKFVETKNAEDADYWITNYYLDKTIYDENFFLKYSLIKINLRFFFT